MRNENPTSIYRERVEVLVAAGILSDRVEPVGVSLFAPLPPLLHEVQTRRVAQEGTGALYHFKPSVLRAMKRKVN